MTDAFALLGESRRPWLDPDTLKSRFLEFSAPLHPDRFHGASDSDRLAVNHRFAELSAAYNALKEPRDRLLHLLELESGTKPRDVQRIPPGTMDLFVEIGQACRETDEFLKNRVEAPSPMLKLKQLQQSLHWTDRLDTLQKKVFEKQAEIFVELQALNPIWETAPAVGSAVRQTALPLERLEQLYRSMSYVTRWTEQLRERMVQLAN